jgi:hypothetical protein
MYLQRLASFGNPGITQCALFPPVIQFTRPPTHHLETYSQEARGIHPPHTHPPTCRSSPLYQAPQFRGEREPHQVVQGSACLVGVNQLIRDLGG